MRIPLKYDASLLVVFTGESCVMTAWTSAFACSISTEVRVLASSTIPLFSSAIPAVGVQNTLVTLCVVVCTGKKT